jgi:hypothetical protein
MTRAIPFNAKKHHAMAASQSIKGQLKQIPAGIWVLGFVSMLMDISSEMIHALLPIYMVTVLGTSTLAVGIIERIAEATAAITKASRERSPTGVVSARASLSLVTAWQPSPSPSFHSLPTYPG